ncbi:MAG: ribonuclease P protein component [Fluviibacter sp.]
MIPSRYRFSRASRLLKPSEFQTVFDARKACRGQWLTVHRYQPGSAPVCPADASLALIDPDITSRRLGLIVAKRLVAASARRNMIRRIVREHFRTTPAAFPTGDWIVRLHESPFRIKKGEPSRTRSQIVTGLRSDLAQILNRVSGQIRRENQALTQ